MQTYKRAVHEMLNEIGKASNQTEKLKLIKQYDCRALRDVLHGTYDERVKFLVPEPPIPYDPSSDNSPPSNLLRQTKNIFPYLVNPRIKQLKREELLIRMLESIHPKDAAVVEQMLKKEPYKGISRGLVKKAYPNFFPKDEV